MKKVFIILFIGLLIYIPGSIYFLNSYNFISPIDYQKDIIIRNDNRGDGFFAAKRSGNRLHNGVDLWAAVGRPVLAARSGIVIAATASRGMGNYVILKHSGGIITIYGHLLHIYVKKWDFVRQGQVIGAVGKTGNANSSGIQPHLHFELRKTGIPQDPLQYLE